MKTIHFHRNKYGVELLMDLGTYESIPHYFFQSITHQTDFFEIVFFSKVDGYLSLSDQRIDLNPGTIVFMSPFQKRKWFVDKKSISAHFLIFQEDFLNDFFADKLFVYRLQYFFNYHTPLFIRANEVLFKKMLSVFPDILQEIQNYQSDSRHLIRSLLYFILTKLNRNFSQTYQLSKDTQNYTLAYQFKALLEDNFKQEQRVQFYSENLNTSRISLNKIIKKQFGMTISRMIKQRVLFEIKDRLIYRTDSIAEIAYDLNFSEPNHLMRFFKQHTGQTPSDFRLSYQNGSSLI